MNIVNVGKVLLRRNTDGKYLILRGSKWEERPDRSLKPDLPGGTVEPGETFEQASTREVFEETGISVNSDKMTLVHAFSFVNAKENEAINRLIFFVEVDHNPEVILSWEHDEYWWLSAEDVLGLEIREPYPEVFRHIRHLGLLV